MKIPTSVQTDVFLARWLLRTSKRVPHFANVCHLTIHNVEKDWATFGFKLARRFELKRFSWVKLTYEQHDNAYRLEVKTNQPPSVDLSVIKEANRARRQAWQNVMDGIPADSITDREALFLTENTTAVKLGHNFYFWPAGRNGIEVSGHEIRKEYRDITEDLKQRYPGCFTGFE
eukprot:Skav201667  [mRNA]  locus=scaffold641:306827:307348:+ [translate_table: standard]